jgi:hypothetical protein
MTTEKKMGRPARAGGPARNVTVRASEQERALWEAAAAAEGLELADWIRAACDARAARRI